MSDRAEKSVLAAHRSRLGKVPDQQVADLAGVSRTLVVNYRKKLGIPPYQGHKGAPTQPKATVEDARPFRGRRSALDPYTNVLGTVPDAEIARLAGVTPENVRTYRQRRNIAAVWQDGAPTEAATPPKVAAQAETAKVAAPATARAAPNKVALSPNRATPAPPVMAPSRAVAPVEARPEAMMPPSADTAFLVVVETDGGPRQYALVAGDIAAAAALASARVLVRHPAATIRSVQRVAELLPT